MLSTPKFNELVTSGKDLRRKDSSRSFNGISKRLWYGVGDQIFSSAWPTRAGEPPVEYMIDASGNSLENTLRFNRRAQFDVYVDCLYFSVATMTTLGFGDITPRSIYVKIAALIQVLIGVLLVAVGIGLALGSERHSNQVHEDAAR
jgi:hypothetical protein